MSSKYGFSLCSLKYAFFADLALTMELIAMAIIEKKPVTSATIIAASRLVNAVKKSIIAGHTKAMTR